MANKSGIHIKKSHEGLFTARAKRQGHSMGEQISKDLKEGGNEARQANFARMARRGWKPLGKKHEGGLIGESGVYELEKGEKVIPQGTVSNVREPRSNMGSHSVVCEGYPSDKGNPSGPGHWEGDGNDIHFVNEGQAGSREHQQSQRIKGKMHDGGTVPKDGLYEMEKGEVVIPANAKGPKVTMGKGMQRVEPGQSGKFSDRIKIAPKYGMSEIPSAMSDSERQKKMHSPETQI